MVIFNSYFDITRGYRSAAKHLAPYHPSPHIGWVARMARRWGCLGDVKYPSDPSDPVVVPEMVNVYLDVGQNGRPRGPQMLV